MPNRHLIWNWPRRSSKKSFKALRKAWHCTGSKRRSDHRHKQGVPGFKSESFGLLLSNQKRWCRTNRCFISESPESSNWRVLEGLWPFTSGRLWLESQAGVPGLLPDEVKYQKKSEEAASCQGKGSPGYSGKHQPLLVDRFYARFAWKRSKDQEL